jgi:hypothetical protein
VQLTGASLTTPGGHVSLEAQGKVALSDHSLVDVGGVAPGSVSIRGGQVVVEQGSQVLAENEGADPGGRIEVAASESLTVDAGLLSVNTSSAGAAGTIDVHGGTVDVHDGGEINASSSGSGNGGTIAIGSDLKAVISISLHDVGRIVAKNSNGNGGSIALYADSVSVGGRRPGTDLDPKAQTGLIDASGNAGTILVHATDSIVVADPETTCCNLDDIIFLGYRPSGITAASGRTLPSLVTLEAPEIALNGGASILTNTGGEADGGAVLLRGTNIHIMNGSAVDTSSFSGATAGDVTLEATESIEVGKSSLAELAGRVSSTVYNTGRGGDVILRAPQIVVDGGTITTVAIASIFGTGGEGGNITLEGLDGAPAKEILVRSGGDLDTSTLTAGKAGNIELRASGLIRVEDPGSGIKSRTVADGPGGKIRLDAPLIEIATGGQVSARSAPFQPGVGDLGPLIDALASINAQSYLAPLPETATGDAGAIKLTADEVRLDGGTIATDAVESHGGNIEIEARRLVHLIDGDITTAVSASGGGGNISIDPVFVILQKGSVIRADAGPVAGDGGHISITSDNLFAFPDSEISATSGTGVAGSVEIHSPAVNLAGTLAQLPTNFLDAASRMRERCAARRSGERAGSFAVRGPGGIPAEPDGWLPAPLLPDVEAATAAALPASPTLVASLSGPLLAHGACP